MTDLLTLAARLNITATTAALESFAAAVRSEALVTACETIRKLAAQVDPPRPAPLQARDALVTVVAAAVRHDDGTIYTLPPPAGHEKVIAMMVRTGKAPGEDAVRGFLLSDGRFVLPDRAGEIVVEAGQIERLPTPPYLYPQDLWSK